MKIKKISIRNNDKAPGIKIIYIIFIIFISLMILYYIWYLKIEKLSEEKLITFQNELKKNNISLIWKNIEKSGFPYRIVNKLNSIEVKLNDTEVFLENLNIIYQPWNINHVIIKTSDKINILNKNNKIIIYPEVIASILIDKFKEKRISINIDELSFMNSKYTHKINNPKIYFKNDSNNNLQYIIKIKELFLQPAFIENNAITNINISGNLINYRNININNYYKWLTDEGGIDIENFKLNIDQILINGNAFLGVDENMNIQSSISLESNNLDKLFLILKNNNLITKNTLEISDFIIKAIEIASKTSNIKPKFSINIQNGYFSLMGVKLFDVPNLAIFK